MKIINCQGGMLRYLWIGAIVYVTVFRCDYAAETIITTSTNISEQLLAAAREGNSQKIAEIIEISSNKNISIGAEGAKQLLYELGHQRELSAFLILLDEMRKSHLAIDWQADDTLLNEIIKDKRKDFLDALLARRLDLGRLRRVAENADKTTAEWLNQRVVEVRKQRADIDELVKASGDGDLPVMRKQLDAGVDINGVSRHDFTPLTFAAIKNQPSAVQLLLDRGAKVDKPRYPGWDYTPLCLTQSVEIAEMLKKAGANTHATLYARNVSILTYIARWGGGDLVEWCLKQGLDPKMIGDNKENLLFEAGDAKTAKLLIDAGVDPNQANEFGQMPITEAANAGVAKELIKAGAKVSGLDKPVIPEMIQCYASADAIEYVLEAGADYDQPMLQDALISAAQRNEDKTALVLLKYGAEANDLRVRSPQDHKISPLLMCCMVGATKTARLLLEYGADPNAGEKEGQCLKTAMSNGHKDIAELLHKAGARGMSDLAFYVAMRNVVKVKELLIVAPSYAKDKEFWTDVLTGAIKTGDLKTVRVAIEKGVPITSNKRDNAFNTAASEGRHEVLDVLLEHCKAKDYADELRHALWAAVWDSHPNEKQRPAEAFEKCVRLLIDAGAKVVETKDEEDLVKAAVFTRYPGGNPKVIEMLVAAGADPNPQIGFKDHLSDAIQQTCQAEGCSTQFAETVSTIERLAKVSIDRQKK